MSYYHDSLPSAGREDSFDIRKHSDRLKPSPRKKGKYICPACDGESFSINQKTGAYSCFSSGCESKDIRDAIAPLPQQTTVQRNKSQHKRQQPQNSKKIENEIQADCVSVEKKVDDLFLTVLREQQRPEEALVELGVWCRKNKLPEYPVSQLFQKKMKDLKEIVASQVGSDVEDKDFDQLRKIQHEKTSLNDWDASDILPIPLGESVSHDAPILNVVWWGFLAYILSISASLLPRMTHISAGSFAETPTIWSCIIGESVSGKTRIQKITFAWLRQEERQKYERYKKGN